MAVVEEVRLIMSDICANSNKFWYGFLHDDGSITSRNGRVGITEVENSVKGNGKRDFDRLVNSKLKKGYSELKTVASTSVAGGTNLAKQDLKAIASKQIKTDKPELTKLIDRLVTANIHKITSSTNISYNDVTGLFSTPLGIVTLDAITDARDLLVIISDSVKADDYGGPKFMNSVNQYLRLVPQNVGMRLDVRRLFPDDTAVQKQSDLLDSLESSYKALQTSPKKTADDKPVIEEQVFDVELGSLDSSDSEYRRLSDFFYNTKKRMHGYDNIKIVNIYKVKIADMDRNFNRKLIPIVECFHGTSQANLLSIMKSGLKVSPPSTAQVAGKLFDNGIYGAINSSKSLGYTLGKWGQSLGDSGWLFIADFSMGKIFEPTTYGCRRPKDYDSVWAKADKTGLKHDELIVYSNEQVNLKYLIECK
jgi:poly [ADP-ribose] polymerase